MKWHPRTDLCIVIANVIVFHIIANSEAGFSCVSNPCVYGICVDDINSTYTCYCVNGYTGIQCQTNWDECWSSPCANGATCIDGIDSYNCSCAEGFTGSNCEHNIDECASNPCANNGTCFDNANGFTCHCQPGYSGIFCEIDLAVCNTSNEIRCHNGGLCVDGPGLTYSCSCQSGWIGTLCDEPINECASSPCQNGGVCIDLHANYACACLFGYTGRHCETELELCDMNSCSNGALCLIEDDMRVCYCVPDFHGDRCQFQYDECQLRGRCYNGGTCIDGVDNYTCSCPPYVTGAHCECTRNAYGTYECSTEPPFFETTRTYYTETVLPELTDQTTTTKTTTASISGNGSLPSTLYFEASEKISTILLFPITTTIVTLSDTDTTLSSEKEFVTTEIVTRRGVDHTGPREVDTTHLSNLPTTTVTELETTIFENVTTELSQETTVVTFSPSPSSYSSSSEIPPTFSARITLKSVFFTTPQHIYGSSITESKLSTFDTTTKSTEVALINTTTECCVSTNTATQTIEEERTTEYTSITDEDWYVTRFFNESTSISPTQCSNTTCLNGGTCYISIDSGPKCVCRFGWEGAQCEDSVTIKVVAFTGKSYLMHHLNNGTSTIVSLKLKTLSSFGIVFYAQVTSNMYICLYVQDGFLKFQFSCGVQTMLFSETKYRINNGYQVSILATVALNKNILQQNFEDGECSAALRINNTVAMSGEQTSASAQNFLNVPALYIGGFPKYLVQQLDLPVSDGIIGCMHSLQIDGISRDIYMNAVDGYEIAECSSLACISSPCHYGATCMENEQSWTCLCPLGFVGKTCSISVCVNNPCQFGGTCVQYPTNGFLCLCPLGKHGLFCEQELEISQPTFSSTMRGYSSFIAYQLPISSIQHTFELRFKFIPESMDQIALMLFMGQDGEHGSNSDHLSLSFIKGHIALTWNLGAGPRRIFTPRPITKRGKKMHTVKIGRTGSRAWLYVDGFKNITGRALGKYMQLNVTPIIYIGGHESYNFLTLPHDLPLHTGFAGCIYDVEIRTSHVTLGLQKAHPIIGRSVAQCGTSECSNYTCQHGGACLQHGPTFSCLCPDGWFGPVCAYRHNLCDSNYHRCAFGSTCVPSASAYECDCTPGQTGRYCEKHETQLSDISFSGKRSYLLLFPHENFSMKQFNFEVEFKAISDRALIMYLVEKELKFFTSLTLKGGILEFRISIFGASRKSDFENDVVKVRSGIIISTGKWTKVKAGRFGQKLYLSVNGVTNSKIIPADNTFVLNNVSIYFGGSENLSNIQYNVISGVPVTFSGCIRQFYINYQHIILNESNIMSGRNIADCDGTPCGADVCSNGGTCWLNTTLKPHCMCPEEYNGERCEMQVSCAAVPCKNKGRCVEETNNKLICHCPLGWTGPFCEKEMPSVTPFLKGDSYIIVDKKLSRKRQSGGNRTSTVDLVHVKFSTTQENGLLLWNTKGEQFFGIGVENGNLKIVWSMDGSLNQVLLTSNATVNNGFWHTVTFRYNETDVLSTLDNEEICLENQAIKYFLNMDDLYYLGGFPDNRYVVNETNGIFSSNFNGCIEEFAWNENMIITNFKKYRGENVGSCFDYKG